MKLAVGIGFAGMLAAVTAFAVDPQKVEKSVGDRVYCVCGCATTLNHCPHPESECAVRVEMHKLIKKDLAEGKNENLILGDFVLKYGAEMLASPPAKVFDLTVWFLPGLVAIAGLALVIFLVRRFRRPPGESSPPPAPIDPKVLAALEEEMKKVMR